MDCRKVKCVALTFDDGPGQSTGKLLAELRKAKVPATFFVLGWRAEASPTLIKRIVRDGHEIGNHSYDHPNLTTLTAKQIKSQLVRTDRAIEAAGGARPRLVRPPFGAFSAEVCKVAGRPMVLWNVDPLDWRDRDVRKVTRRVVTAKPGSIVLMHDIRPSTVKAIPGIVKKLRARGFTLVTVSQLVSADQLRPGEAVYSGLAPQQK